ncbi:hypothetical protein [Rhodoligotrophos ferricapiens]|uniref:hypothetical protein n=1 Tax=Rhodoligotrophos ferricapiens TaxID=3069264 RepID=UPI00315D14FE
MTDLIPVSYAELVRSGVHALRGLGFRFSSAERGAHTLAASQAATGLALRAIRLAQDRIGLRDRPAIGVSELRAGILRIDAGGRSLLEMAPLLVDALAADAKRHGRAVLLAENCPDLPFVVDLAVRSRHLACAMACLYQSGSQGDATAGGFVGRGDQLIGGALTSEAFAMIASSPVIERFNAGSLVSACDGGRDRVLLLASDGDADALAEEPLWPGLFSRSERQGWQDASRWLGAIEQSIKGEILVDPEDFAFFTSCVARIWVPTSERSRAQQG